MPNLEEVIRQLTRSQDLGFLGALHVEQQAAHALTFERGLEGAATCLDLGAGGGLPGLVLASQDDRTWTFLDAMEKRCRFLQEAVEGLGVADRVSVACGRAEELARGDLVDLQVDTVVARSFGPPLVAAECATAFLDVGGRLLVSEPPEGEDRWSELDLSPFGLHVKQRFTEPGLVVLEKAAPHDPRLPRRAKLLGRPL